MKSISFLFIALLLTACGEDPYRNLYNGINSNNAAKKTPNERAVSPTPGYDEYKKEREQK